MIADFYSPAADLRLKALMDMTDPLITALKCRF